MRSNGYLKMAQSAAVATNNNVARNKDATHPRAAVTTLETFQKVYVRGGQKEEEPLEMVVYNQGMFKN